MILQLLRTTPYLSGQIRNDLIVQDGMIDDINIVPLSDEVVYNEDNTRLFLNYDYSENVKYLYKTLGGEFFANKQKYSGSKYIYNNTQLKIDTADHTYMCGLRRVNRYKRYNKQFSFLLPLWISEDIDFNKLTFKVQILGADSNFVNIEKNIVLSKQIADYYNSFFKTTDDNLINLKLDTNQAYISGIDVSTGQKITKDISYIITNLLYRERPVMELDSIFVSLFKEHNMISQQLFNCNLVFDLFDITTHDIISQLDGKPLNARVYTYYAGKQLDIKDFYTNYEFIPATVLENNNIKYDDNLNVLDYLNDYNNIDNIYDNKLTQPIFHWALLENKEYTYNLYDGFAPLIELPDKEKYRICGHYQNQGDLSSDKFDIFDNNLAWCLHNDLKNYSALDARIFLMENDDKYTKININNQILWCHNNKYDITSIYNSLKTNNVSEINVKTVKLDNNIRVAGFLDNIFTLTDDNNEVQIMYRITDDGRYFFIILSNNIDNLTIKRLCSFRQNNIPDSFWKAWNMLVMFLKCYVLPFKIEFKKSIYQSPVPIINKKIKLKEIEYFKKDDNHYNFVYRYFGRLIPHFINVDDEHLFNYIYFYEQWNDISELHIISYNELMKMGYLPNYPSLDIGNNHKFFALTKEKCLNAKPKFYDDWNWEITHFFDNKFFNLPESFKIEFILENGVSYSNDEIESIVYQKFFEWFSYLNLDELTLKQFVLSLYNYNIIFTYESLTNINNIKYEIFFELK